MKPLQLVLSAWGPYKNKEQVDFEKLGKNGIFLITGPTGAGKTTIFDGISYALFGDVSGEVRQKDNLRSDFAEDGVKTYAELLFSHKGKQYTVYRKPKYWRLKKNGTGYTSESEDANLYEEDKLLAAGNKQVNEKIKVLLSIDHNQFKQIVMIAQGEFQRLLMAGSKERTVIFRDIFQTRIYDVIQTMLSHKGRGLKDEITAIRNRLDQAVSSVMIENEEWDKLLESEEKQYEKLSLLLADHIADTSNIEKELKKQLTAWGDNKKELIQQMEIQKKRKETSEKLNYTVQEIEELEKESRQISDMENKIIQINKAAQIIGLEDYYNRAVDSYRKEMDICKTLDNRNKELAEQLKLVAVKLAKKDEMQRQVDQYTKELPLLEQTLESWKRYVKEVVILGDRQHEYLEYDEAAKVAKQIYEEKEDSFKKAAAGVLAVSLKEGQPCPVCGSLGHPIPAQIESHIPNEEEITRLKEVYEKSLEKANDKQKAAVESHSIVKSLQTEIEEAVQIFSSLDMLKAHIEAMNKEMKKFKNQIATIDTTHHQLEMDMQTGKVQLADTKNRLLGLEKNKGDAWDAYQKKLEDAALKEQEYFSLRKERMNIEIYNKQVKRYHNQYERLKNTKIDLQQELKNKELLDIVILQTQLIELEHNEKAVSKERDHIIGMLTGNKNAQKSIKSEIKKKEILEKEYGIVKDLDKVTKGVNNRHIVFEQYILSVYFDEMLLAANMRLKIMTNNRYQLSRVLQVEDARTKESLDIEVLDKYTGKPRSVKSLSGGEIFKASLSLALGMSDIIQNNAGGIEIDALFIDEGFGALDQESLNQAISALSGLVKDNRLIGIISHVEELKERIDNQIVIEVSPTGSKIKT